MVTDADESVSSRIWWACVRGFEDDEIYDEMSNFLDEIHD